MWYRHLTSSSKQLVYTKINWGQSTSCSQYFEFPSLLVRWQLRHPGHKKPVNVVVVKSLWRIHKRSVQKQAEDEIKRKPATQHVLKAAIKMVVVMVACPRKLNVLFMCSHAIKNRSLVACYKSTSREHRVQPEGRLADGVDVPIYEPAAGPAYPVACCWVGVKGPALTGVYILVCGI